MKGKRRTLFEIAPDRFILPGQSKNGEEPLPDLIFERDASIRGLYRAKLEHSDLTPKNGNGLIIKKASRL